MNFRKLFSLIGTTTFVFAASSFSVKNDTKINNLSITQNLQNQIHQNDKFIKMNGTDGQISSLVIKKKGVIFAGSSNGTIYKSKDGEKFIKAYSDNIKGAIRAMVTTDNGVIYAAKLDSNKTIIYQRNNKGGFFQLASINSQVLVMTTDKFNTLYIGTNNQGVSYWDGQTKKFIRLEGTTGEILSLTTTTNGLLYAGTNTGKIYKSFGYGFQIISKISKDEDTGEILMYNPIVDDEKIPTILGADISSLTTDNKNNVYDTSFIGMTFNKIDGEPFFHEFKNLLNVPLTSITTIKNNVTYIGDSRGQLWKSNNTKNLVPVTTTVKETKILSLKHNRNNKIYAGTTDGVYRLD